MKIVTVKIELGKYIFDFVTDLNVMTSWSELTDKATITLPRNLRFPAGTWNTELPRGAKVKISIGYEKATNEIFNGYIVRVKPEVPMVIECEDEMWKLKQIEINDTCNSEDLKTFLERVLKIEVDAFDVKVGRFVCNKLNGAQLLDKLKSEYGLHSFFRKILVVGKQYDGSNKEHKVVIDDNIAASSLEYSLKEDYKIKVNAISTLPDGSKIEKSFGDEDGDTRTMNFYNIQESALVDLAKKELERVKYDGYKGGVTLFGEPFVQTSDILKIEDPKDSDRAGKYFIDSVNYTAGINGIRQEVKLGRRA
jgi:hypothetical protein